jgi:hypothetical protein
MSFRLTGKELIDMKRLPDGNLITIATAGWDKAVTNTKNSFPALYTPWQIFALSLKVSTS